jgi:hypothetical protein
MYSYNILKRFYAQNLEISICKLLYESLRSHYDLQVMRQYVGSEVFTKVLELEYPIFCIVEKLEALGSCRWVGEKIDNYSIS